MKIIITFLLAALIFGGGVYYWQSIEVNSLGEKLDGKNVSIQNLTNEKKSLNTKLSDLESDNVALEKKLSIEESRGNNTKIVFDMLKNTEFYPEPSNRTLISIAILLNDESVCDDMDGQDANFCRAVFSSNCEEFEYSNFEMCKKFETMLNREVGASELIAHCNSNESIMNDSGQIECFRYFAKATNNIDLCDEICRDPIDNTNCKAVEIDEEYNPIPLTDIAIKDCKNYILGEYIKNPNINNKKEDNIVIDFNNCEDIKKIVTRESVTVSIWNEGVKDNNCALGYWTDLDDGAVVWESCLVPISIGRLEFDIHDKGVDFESISEYCN